MKIYDMHIHTDDYGTPNQAYLLERLQECGISGGCVFSTHPEQAWNSAQHPFEQRMEDVLQWTDGNDELFPVMFIHPYEKNILQNIRLAVDNGIDAFKIICDSFYVYEEQSMRVLQEIAETGKPVIFHSGILWDGYISSKYNRPLHWEELMNIKNLRFSMGHCSWPWYDECIALYGKFQWGHKRIEGCPEMFYDLTPGAPAVYRKDLFTKLFNTWPADDNIMFGTDCTADRYNVDACKGLIENEIAILDELQISKEVQEKIFSSNLLRFLGKQVT